LSRHVKGHKQVEPLEELEGHSVQPLLTPSSGGVPNIVPPNLQSSISVTPSTHPGNGNLDTSSVDVTNNNAAGIGQIPWPPTARTGEVSSLLWPDSEDLFQSLTSADAAAWNQGGPALSHATYDAHAPSYTSITSEVNDQSQYDELAAAEDGHRAVQTVNRLLTNTVRE
jgi:hypothetical protein